MNNEEYDTFFKLVQLRTPIAELRSTYDAKHVAVRLSVYLDVLFTSLNRYPFSMEWLKDYLIYIFDEGALDVNETYPGSFLRPLDFATLHSSGNLVGVVVDFLLARGATSCNSTSSLLNRYYNRHGYNDVLFKRLIDAGATPPFEGSIPSQLYHSRRATRSVCIALLSLPWKLPLGQGVRQWLPRDVLKMVGKMIWSQRFEYKGRVL